MQFGQRKGDYRRLAFGFLLYLFVLVSWTVMAHEGDQIGEPESVFGWTVFAAAVCTVILFWLFDKRNVKEQGWKASTIFGYVIVFGVLVGLGYGYDTWHLSDTETIVDCPAPDQCNMYRHVHAYVDMRDCGSRVPYRFPLQEGGAALQHTHHEENRIHWHEQLLLDPETLTIAEVEKEKVVLGSFFDRMNVPFSVDEKVCINERCDGDPCDEQEGQWIMHVEEKASNEWMSYEWRDEETIKLEFTSDEAKIAQWKNEANAIHEKEEVFNKFPVTLGVVIGFSAIDSVNPCAFGVLIFLITYLLKSGKRKRDLLIHGMIYIFFVFLTYILAGLILLTFITRFSGVFQAFSNFFYYILAIVVILFGLMELRDYFKEKLHPGEYHAVMAIRPSMKKKIEDMTYKIVDRKSTSAFLGFFVSLVELPCTGAVYLAILAAMAFEGFTTKNIVFLLIYNIIFVLPLIAILLLVYKGMTTFEFKRFYMKHKGNMRLAIAIVLLFMGGWLLESVGFFTVVAQWIAVPGAWKILVAIIIAAFLITAWEVHHARSKKREHTIDESHDPHVAAFEHHEMVEGKPQEENAQALQVKLKELETRSTVEPVISKKPTKRKKSVNKKATKSVRKMKKTKTTSKKPKRSSRVRKSTRRTRR